MISCIHIVGASGAGTSTIGQALEREYGYKWMDTDNYFWLPTDPPVSINSGLSTIRFHSDLTEAL